MAVQRSLTKEQVTTAVNSANINNLVNITEILPDVKRFSHWLRLIRVTARVLHLSGSSNTDQCLLLVNENAQHSKRQALRFGSHT